MKYVWFGRWIPTYIQCCMNFKLQQTEIKCILSAHKNGYHKIARQQAMNDRSADTN